MAGTGYVKIYGSILGSSVWGESTPTRIVWLTMLALADANGHVSESVERIGRLAGVTPKQTERAILALCGVRAISPESGELRINPIDGIKIRKGRNRLSVHVRRRIWARDKGRCVQCGSPDQIEYDHILAVAHGGEDREDNIQLLCRPCNREKGPNAYEDRRLA